MFSDHDETSPSIAAVSAPSIACSMLAVWQQKRLCRQFIDVSAARRACHKMMYTGIKAEVTVATGNCGYTCPEELHQHHVKVMRLIVLVRLTACATAELGSNAG